MADYQEAIQRPYLSKPSVSGQLQPSRTSSSRQWPRNDANKAKCPALPTVEGKPSLVSAFSEDEYRKRIAALKNNKTADIDDILVEQLKNLGPKAHNA